MSYKVPVVKRADYTIYLQELDGMVWAHCDVFRWTSSVSRALRMDADALYRMQGGPWFALHDPPGDKKHEHFLKHVGFKLLGSVESGGVKRQIFKR